MKSFFFSWMLLCLARQDVVSTPAEEGLLCQCACCDTSNPSPNSAPYLDNAGTQGCSVAPVWKEQTLLLNADDGRGPCCSCSCLFWLKGAKPFPKPYLTVLCSAFWHVKCTSPNAARQSALQAQPRWLLFEDGGQCCFSLVSAAPLKVRRVPAVAVAAAEMLLFCNGVLFDEVEGTLVPLSRKGETAQWNTKALFQQCRWTRLLCCCVRLLSFLIRVDQCVFHRNPNPSLS